MKRIACAWTLGVMVFFGSMQAHSQDDTAALFWLSLNPASGAPGPSRLETDVDLFPGTNTAHRVYIWASLRPAEPTAPTGNITSIGLNLRATSSNSTDVLELSRIELDNPLLSSASGINTYRHQFVVDSSEDVFTPCVIDESGMPQCLVVAPCVDSISGECGRVIPPLTIPPDDFFRAAFSGFSISLQFAGRRGVGIGDAARLYAETDPTFDGENWRIGWFEFVPLEVGTVQFFLQVGEPGIGRSGATAATPVYFGSSTEAAVLGNQEFAESAEADALLTIRVMPDYNRNGAVDAADYVVWRKTVGSATELRADGNGDGAVDVQDYNLWKSFFGMVNAGMVNDAAASTEATAAVPEPNALSLIAAAMVGFLLERFRRKGQ